MTKTPLSIINKNLHLLYAVVQEMKVGNIYHLLCTYSMLSTILGPWDIAESK